MSAHAARALRYVEGIAFWAPRLPGWDVARAVIRGEQAAPEPPAPRPAPTLLAPTERRRAPDTVALALEVAARACEAAGATPAELPSRVRLDARRPRDQRLHVRDAREHADADLADQVPQLGAQRRGRLLEHRHRLPRAVHRDQRVRAHVRRRPARGGDAGRRASSEPVLLRRVRHRSDAARWRRWRRAAACSARRWCSRRRRAARRAVAASMRRRERTESTRRRRRARAAATLVAGNALAPCLPFFEALARSSADAHAAADARPCSAGAASVSMLAHSALSAHDRARRRHPRRRPRRPDAGAAAAAAASGARRSWCSSAARIRCRAAAHKVGESSVEIGAHYFDTVLGLKEHLEARSS